MAFTTVDKSIDMFSANLYTGNSTSPRALTGFGHQPDLIWVKRRNGTGNHFVNTSVQGATKWISPDLTSAADTSTLGITYGTDGFTWNGGNYDLNASGETYVCWSWKAGTTSGLSGGTITPSSYSINTTNGFGIYEYTGTGSNATIAHGLGVTPKMIWIKKTSGSEDWRVYHSAVGGATKYMTLNTDSAVSTAATVWNSTAPTSTVFSIGTDGGVNTSSATYVAYVWAEIPGYSKFGKFVGNGNGTNGRFVYTGFKPAFVIIKDFSAQDNWVQYDNKRLGYNDQTYLLYTEAHSAEETANPLHLFGNGFQPSTSTSKYNASGNDYLYIAYAENPIVGSNNITGLAR